MAKMNTRSTVGAIREEEVQLAERERGWLYHSTFERKREKRRSLHFFLSEEEAFT